MGEWRQSTWGEEISLEYGKGIRGYADSRGPYRVFGSNGPVGWADTPLTHGPGVILGRKGAYRGVRFSAEPFSVIDTAYYVRPKTTLDMRWLYYAIIFHKLGEIDDGSPIPSTTRSAVYVRDLSVPDIEEQQAIAAVLSALDDKIELNRRMNETLEASARALFRDWFVDVGPTRAKAEGRPPYLAPDLWSLFPDQMGNDGVPVGWERAVLASIAELNPESWSARNRPPTLTYVDLSNTKWGYIEAVEKHSFDNAPSRARRVLRPGDTIIGTVRPGNGSFAYISESGLTGSTGFAVLRPKERLDQALVWCAATDPSNIERLAHLADGGAYPAVRPDIVTNTEIALPDTALRLAFAEATGPVLNQIEANKRESHTLAETRDALLPKLMSGEIRVRDAEALVAECV